MEKENSDNSKVKKKRFPNYFSKFEIPEWARPQIIKVFRACATGSIDRESFLNSYEENNFEVLAGVEETNPSMYSLSTYKKFKDVRRYMTTTSKYKKPYLIAVGNTNPKYGVCLETKEWKKMNGEKSKSSHVDYWLYEDAEPWLDFQMYNTEQQKENKEGGKE